MNVYSLKFLDNNLADSASGIILNMTSAIDNNQISVSVIHAKSAFKMVPGETHKVVLDESTGKGLSARDYYFQLKPNKNIKNVTFDLTFVSDDRSDLVYSLQVTTLASTTSIPSEIPLVALPDKNLPKLLKLHHNLEAQPGRYFLKLTNLNKEKSIAVAFRFSINGVQEIEENGSFSDHLQPNEFRDLQLMVTKPGQINLTLFNCKKKLVLYTAKASYLKSELNESHLLLTSPADQTTPFLTTKFSKISPGPLYLRVKNIDSTVSDFTLTSTTEFFDTSGLTGSLLKVYPVNQVYLPTYQKNKLIIEVHGPALSPSAMSAVYPKASRLRIDLTVMLYVAHKKTVANKELLLDQFKFCAADLRSHSIFQSNISFFVDSTNLLESQQLRNLTMAIDSSFMQEFGDQMTIETVIAAMASAVVKVKMDVFETAAFSPVATVFGYSDSTSLPSGFIIHAVIDDSNSGLVGEVGAKILLLLIMLLVMVAVLFLFYLGAQKLSGGYAPMNSSEVQPSTTGQALEMADSTTANENMDRNSTQISNFGA